MNWSEVWKTGLNWRVIFWGTVVEVVEEREKEYDVLRHSWLREGWGCGMVWGVGWGGFVLVLLSLTKKVDDTFGATGLPVSRSSKYVSIVCLPVVIPS